MLSKNVVQKCNYIQIWFHYYVGLIIMTLRSNVLCDHRTEQIMIMYLYICVGFSRNNSSFFTSITLSLSLSLASL